MRPFATTCEGVWRKCGRFCRRSSGERESCKIELSSSTFRLLCRRYYLHNTILFFYTVVFVVVVAVVAVAVAVVIYC